MNYRGGWFRVRVKIGTQPQEGYVLLKPEPISGTHCRMRRVWYIRRTGAERFVPVYRSVSVHVDRIIDDNYIGISLS